MKHPNVISSHNPINFGINSIAIPWEYADCIATYRCHEVFQKQVTVHELIESRYILV